MGGDHPMNQRTAKGAVWLPVVAMVLIVLAMPAIPTAAAQEQPSDPGMVVSLASDGTADVTVRFAFDLTTESERAAFRSLRTDDETLATAKDRFSDRMGRVATDIEEATDRSVRVSDPRVDIRTTPDNETGVVEFSVAMVGLTEKRGDRIVLREPFASGYELDRPLQIHAPDGYAVIAASPEPDSVGSGTATWRANTDLSGFSVTVAPDDSASTTTPDASPTSGATTGTDGQAGFGTLGMLLAMGIVVAIGYRYRDR